LDPELVVSFSDTKADEVSGFARYEEYGDRWLQVESINGSKAKTRLEDVGPDVVFVMSWQELIAPDLLEIPEQGYVGRHLSLLPKRRGRAPVAWALIHGLDVTGTTLFWLDEGVDSGDIIAQTEVPIQEEDEAGDLFAKQADATVELLSDVIESFDAGEFPRRPQDDSEATYTHPRRPDMGLIDWQKSAKYLYNFVRGQTHPYPGAFTYNKMDKMYVWHSEVTDQTRISGKPGEVLAVHGSEEYRVQTGTGILDIEVENVDGEHPVETGSVLGGYTLPPQ
jgi:methionyl-tRNA formyltransferase